MLYLMVYNIIDFMCLFDVHSAFYEKHRDVQGCIYIRNKIHSLGLNELNNLNNYHKINYIINHQI